MRRMASMSFAHKPIAGVAAAALLMLSACGDGDIPEQQEVSQSIEDEGIASPEGEVLGTPMAERVAILGLLNKRNGKTRDIELQPGQALRLGDRLVIRLRACEKSAPWENHPEQGAFVQLMVNERQIGDGADNWQTVFSGWLFKENPALNVVQHPVYDVWIKECRMRFPGDEDGDAAPVPPAASSSSSAAQSPESDSSASSEGE